MQVHLTTLHLAHWLATQIIWLKTKGGTIQAVPKHFSFICTTTTSSGV